ncbi:methionyl-tRNA formyltransferase [Chitinispirillales bacterium ANBcel5]|uniref:methionyl-tRNA formyltransferase n=1 Tax=Cellulosispirillum alkaliphilum TaxID=3039283 RepID=UPI002A5711F3|nr:methionyl-tRNA formyltransferase [Chitinispirillales bacterium ANBcel5]
MNIVFMGSADFGIPALEKLAHKHTIKGVVTTPAKPRGRGLKLAESPVFEYAKTHRLGPILKPPRLKDPQFAEQLKNLNAEVFVVIAYRILPREIFSIPEFGTINVHASLLPKYRGAAPIHRAIEAGEKETGVTVFRIDEGIDTGEILLQKKTAVGSKETTPELYTRLSTLGADAIEEVVEKFHTGTIQSIRQSDELESKAPKLSRSEALIDWGLTSGQIFNKIRAFKPFPGSYTIYNKKRLSVEWAEAHRECECSGQVGEICAVERDYFMVKCGSGCLKILEVKPEGRKKMDAGAFVRGTKLKKGTVLG